MGTLVRVQQKGQVTIPTLLRSRAGILEGDLVEASFERGKIVLTPQLVIDRSKLSAAAGANHEYTPAQRKLLEQELALGLADLKKGRVHGPFKAREAAQFLRTELRIRAKAKKQSR